MIGQECIDELADYAGRRAEVSAVTEAAMRGELDFEAALRARVALLEGVPVSAIADCLATRIHPTPGGATLVATMRAGGALTKLVSGGFTAFAKPVCDALGFDLFHANFLGLRMDRLDGTLVGPIIDAAAKKTRLESGSARAGCTPDDALALGDGANDREMVALAGLGVAFRAKPALAAIADARLDHHGLDALLWAQGIRRADWSVRPDPLFAA
jgi:phosphoserine phosphatase